MDSKPHPGALRPMNPGYSFPETWKCRSVTPQPLQWADRGAIIPFGRPQGCPIAASIPRALSQHCPMAAAHVSHTWGRAAQPCCTIYLPNHSERPLTELQTTLWVVINIQSFLWGYS